MPLVPVPVALPPSLFAVEAGDADGDGVAELVAVERVKKGTQPDGARLHVMKVDPAGAVRTAFVVDLQNRPVLWDVERGLWLLDKDGFSRVDPATGRPARVAAFATPLAALGPTTPTAADLAWDLDGDGGVELLAWSAGRVWGWKADGTALGSVPAPGEGDLSTRWEQGGQALGATVRPPRLAVQDVDGDGRRDVVLPDGDRARVYYTGATLGVRAGELRFPVDLDPEERPLVSGETRREVSGAWLLDLDGDRKMDLAVHRTVLAGSWFGATAEVVWARGNGAGFGPLQTVSMASTAFRVEPRDADGDGDLDLAAALVDTGLGNLARALVSREVRVHLSLFRFGGGAYGPASALRTVVFPLERPDGYHGELSGDVDGDRRLDLVTDDGGAELRVYRGTATGLEPEAGLRAAVPIPAGDETLRVADLTGDGRAEIIVWAPEGGRGTVLFAR